VQKIHDAFKKSLDDPKVLAVMDRYQMPQRYADPKGYIEIVNQVMSFEAEGVKRIGLGKDS
jgi:hypothetical protein